MAAALRPVYSPSPQQLKLKGYPVHNRLLHVDEFTLECGRVLKHVDVAYMTWGALNNARDNAIVICHALSGSADATNWWGPLVGDGKAFDTSTHFVVCCNMLGSPYGTTSPLTINPNTEETYGQSFPRTTIRDSVRLHKLVLDHLGVSSIKCVAGGSLGGMQALEWSFFGSRYVRSLVLLATCGRHSPWAISFGEVQRQAIRAHPRIGLAAARMSGMMSYRSFPSFQRRFGRLPQLQPSPHPSIMYPVSFLSKTELLMGGADGSVFSPSANGIPARKQNSSSSSSSSSPSRSGANAAHTNSHLYPSVSQVRALPTDASLTIGDSLHRPTSTPLFPVFAMSSYLHHQGEIFVNRFDANCFVSLTYTMDSHDVSRGRGEYYQVLKSIVQPALVVGKIM